MNETVDVNADASGDNNNNNTDVNIKSSKGNKTNHEPDAHNGTTRMLLACQ
jgi:hypothetical protein